MIVGHNLKLPYGHGAQILPTFRPSLGEKQPYSSLYGIILRINTMMEYNQVPSELNVHSLGMEVDNLDGMFRSDLLRINLGLRAPSWMLVQKLKFSPSPPGICIYIAVFVSSDALRPDLLILQAMDSSVFGSRTAPFKETRGGTSKEVNRTDMGFLYCVQTDKYGPNTFL